jgi:hypothetical protein
VRTLVLLGALLCVRPALAAGPVPFAGRIDAESHARLVPGGTESIGGIGDWALTNGTLCAVVSDPGRASSLSTSGGGLVDLGHCGRADDQLVLVQPLANLERSGALSVDRVVPAADAGEARLVATGGLRGCVVETTYALDLADPTRLRITTRAVRREPGGRLFALADIALHTEHALRPFGFDPRRPVAAAGFVHPAVDVASPLSIVRATRAVEAKILSGAQDLEPGIAYGVRSLGARLLRGEGGEGAAELSVLSVSDVNFSAFTAFAGPFWRGPTERLGPLEVAQALFMDLAPGDALVWEREIRVSDRSDAASLTDLWLPQAPRVSGRVRDARARIHVHDGAGHTVTERRPDADGRFALRLPKGAFRLDVLGPGGGESSRSVEVGDADVDLGDVEVPAFGEVALPRGRAMRLVFLGEGGTPDPRFGEERPPLRFGEATPPSSRRSRDVHLAGAAGDPRTVALAPGRYRVLATRGPEFSLARASLEVRAGETTPLVIAAPERVVESPGWIAADLHVHAAPSDDSALPLDLRLASYVAEGAEVLVATDHNRVTDYGPLIRELALASAIASVVGQEVTSSVRSDAAPHTIGHSNVFPLALRPLEHAGGALASEGRRLRSLIAEVRGLGGERIVQLNHARELHPGGTSGYFEHLSVPGEPFDPGLPLGSAPNSVLLERDPTTGVADLDFDAMELLNGPSMPRYRSLREDWFALLRQGVVRTATANSDSHILAQIAAAPRTLVALEPDDPARFDEAAFVRAIRSGRAYGTTGPLLEVAVGGAGIGETGRGADAELDIAVRAAPWVPVSRVRVLVDGAVLLERPIGRGDRLRIPHRFSRDAFVTFEVEGEPEGDYAAVLPGFTPFAFTNPIFVDADGDGRWRAPEAR